MSVNYICKFYDDRLKQDRSYFNPKPHWDETDFKGKLVAVKIRRIESFWILKGPRVAGMFWTIGYKKGHTDLES